MQKMKDVLTNLTTHFKRINMIYVYEIWIISMYRHEYCMNIINWALTIKMWKISKMQIIVSVVLKNENLTSLPDICKSRKVETANVAKRLLKNSSVVITWVFFRCWFIKTFASHMIVLTKNEFVNLKYLLKMSTYTFFKPLLKIKLPFEIVVW